MRERECIRVASGVGSGYTFRRPDGIHGIQPRCVMAIDKFGDSDPVGDWSRNINDIMDEMLKRNFVDFRDVGPWKPTTNVYETDAAYHVCLELAGVQEDQIDVECEAPATVKISGARAQPRPDGETGPLSMHVLEIDEGAFARELKLPGAIDIDRVDATYDRGYLWITLPKMK